MEADKYGARISRFAGAFVITIGRVNADECRTPDGLDLVTGMSRANREIRVPYPDRLTE